MLGSRGDPRLPGLPIPCTLMAWTALQGLFLKQNGLGDKMEKLLTSDSQMDPKNVYGYCSFPDGPAGMSCFIEEARR